jgi:PKHD-type hydroxylase
MVAVLTNILTPDEIAHFRSVLSTASWVDGRSTATGVAAQVKANLQLADADPLRADLAQRVVVALVRSPGFTSAALPIRVYPPGFNRYTEGGAYGDHVDNAMRSLPGTSGWVRTDLSATLFLANPDEYDGGELIVRESTATYTAKLPAGDLFLYPATAVHSVQPVTRGERLASFFWVQSMVRDNDERTMLSELEQSAQRVLKGMPGDPTGVQLVALYHNLLRRWGST